MMRALICKEWGSFENLVLGTMPTPIPQADELLIAVHASAVNYADSIMIAGKYQTKPALPFVPGLETAGVVLECGAQVTQFSPGQRVMATVAYGALAEFVTATEHETIAIPDQMSFEHAGAFPISYLSSHVALQWEGRLQPGETLLVLGASGGVGLTAVEIGKAMGARVIAAASTDEKLAITRMHGADDTINYTTENLTERVMTLTNGKGADVCFDPVGGPLFDSALSAVGWGGRILLVGFVAGVQQISANRLLVKNRSAMGSSLRHFRQNVPDKYRQSVKQLLAWYQEGKLIPCVSHTLPLERGIEAIRLLTERKAYGKVVVLF
jgi:NADPH2:quinone reductase